MCKGVKRGGASNVERQKQKTRKKTRWTRETQARTKQSNAPEGDGKNGNRRSMKTKR